jgi:hypothetical protein
MDEAGIVAVIGLVVTTVVTIGLTVRQMQRTSWLESAKQLPSDNAAERAVGLAAAIDYLKVRQLKRPALRIAVDRLHYEDDPLIVYRVLQAFSDNARLLKSAIRELLIINRHVWLYLQEEFAKTCLDPHTSPTGQSLKTHLEKLERNQRSTSILLQRGRDFKRLNFSGTFYPNLQAPGVTFKRCNFRSSLLHYSNFYGAVFKRCELFDCILIGSYLEEADFSGRTEDRFVDYTARYHRAKDDKDSSPTPPSFMWETEQGWHGHWVEKGRDEQDQTTKREFSAKWPKPFDKKKIKKEIEPSTINATIFLEGENGPFTRTDCDPNKPNDGNYEITSRTMLDGRRNVVLVGGTRTLSRGVPSVWWSIWWQQLGSQRPMQIMPITDPKEPGRGA